MEVIPPGPALQITKQVLDAEGVWLDADTATGPALPSGAVSFRVNVTNIGNVNLTGVTVSDPKYSGSPITIGDLAIGASVTREFTLPWVAGQQTNTATANGLFGSTPVTDFDSAYYIGAQAGIHLEKTADKTTAAVGDTVTYTFTVTNTGTVPLFSVGVFDSIAGDATYQSGDTNTNNQLEPTETWIFNDTYIVQSVTLILSSTQPQRLDMHTVSHSPAPTTTAWISSLQPSMSSKRSRWRPPAPGLRR